MALARVVDTCLTGEVVSVLQGKVYVAEGVDMYAKELHANGVHTECVFPARKTGGAVGISARYFDGDSPAWCIKAGKIERTHGHDFDGPLWAACGCPEDGE